MDYDPPGPLVQLQAFADFEVVRNPGKPGQTHIAQWAVEEIERLMAENQRLRLTKPDDLSPF